MSSTLSPTHFHLDSLRTDQRSVPPKRSNLPKDPKDFKIHTFESNGYIFNLCTHIRIKDVNQADIRYFPDLVALFQNKPR